MKAKKYITRVLLIGLMLPFSMHSQERGGGNFKGFGKDNSKDYIKGNVSGKIVDSKTGVNLDYASISLTYTDWGKVI